MDDEQIKSIAAARYNNPKFVFDGKRMRTFTTRRTVDYADALLKNYKIPTIFKNSYLIKVPLKSQIISDCFKDNEVFELKDKKTETIIYKNKKEKDIFKKISLNEISFKMSNRLHLKNQDLFFNQPDFRSRNILDCLPIRMAHFSVNKTRSQISTLAFTLDGRRLLSGNALGEFTLWNGQTFSFDTIMQAHDSQILKIKFSSNPDYFLSSDNNGNIKYWSNCLNNVKIIPGEGDAIRDLDFNYNNSKFVSASDDSKVRVYDTATGEIENIFTGHGWDVRSTQWNKQYNLIGSASRDNLVKLWDPREKLSLIKTFHIHKNSVFAFIFDNSGQKFISGGRDGIIKQVDLRKFRTQSIYKVSKEVTSITTHPFFNDIFTVGTFDGTLLHYKMNEPNEIFQKKDHEGAIWSISYNGMANVLCTGSVDMSCRFWVKDHSIEKIINEEEDVQRLISAPFPNI